MLAGFKRSRDNDDDMGCDAQNDSKKLRTLPFRSSPTSQLPISSFSSRPRTIQRPHILTPVESSDEESDCDLETKDGQPSINLYLADADDMDMDMSDQPVWSPTVPESSFAQSFPSSARSNLTINTPPARMNIATPRIPTPIYGHFSAPSYPTGMPPPSPAMAPPAYVNTLPFPRIRGSGDDVRRRALPSPISEDENMESPTMMTKAMLSNLNMSASPMSEHFSSQETLTPETPERRTWTADSSPKNRRRSDAISGESKVMFSMGFRADCEKCRERVPGHYSHVIRG